MPHDTDHVRVPLAQVVELEHADGGEEKSEEPEKGAGIAEAQIELEKRRQQKHRENKRGEMVAVGHERGSLSNDDCMAKKLSHPKRRAPDSNLPGAGLDC